MKEADSKVPVQVHFWRYFKCSPNSSVNAMLSDGFLDCFSVGSKIPA